MCTDVFKTQAPNPPLLQGFKLEVETVTCASLYLAIVESGTCLVSSPDLPSTLQKERGVWWI